MENTAKNKIGFIVFDVSHEFVLVQISNEMYDVPISEIPDSKYHEIIYVIKTFMDIFGKKMDCWEPMIEHEGVHYYCIQTYLEDLNVDDHDDYDILALNDFNNTDCSDRVKWLSYMALDKTMRKKSIIQPTA